MTYGAGNPKLLGTYQGIRYPEDEDLDYETNVDEVALEKYSSYYNSDGTAKPEFKEYLSLKKDGLRADYRMKVWWETDPRAMIYSYLIQKPWMMINSIFMWDSLHENYLLSSIGYDRLTSIQYIDLVLCVMSIAASVHLKKNRLPMLFLSGTYLGFVYMVATSYSFSRYAASIMFLRFIIIGIGLPLILETLGREINRLTTRQ